MEKGTLDKLIDKYCTNNILLTYNFDYNSPCEICVLHPYQSELAPKGQKACDIELVKKAILESEGVI